MNHNIVGIDTAKQYFQVHGHIAGEPQSRIIRLTRAKFLAYFADLPACRIGMEAYGSAHHWARELKKRGHDVRLLPPQHVKGFVPGRVKSDARDARGCFLAVQQADIHCVPIKSEEQQAARALHRMQEVLVQQRTQICNQLRGLCAEFGLVCIKGIKALMEQLEDIERGRLIVPDLMRELIGSMTAHLRSLHAREQALTQRITLEARKSSLAQRLMKVPGIGPITAHALTSGVVEPKAFASARSFAAWLGLTPSLHASGEKSRNGRITKQGDKSIRRLLVQGAQACLKAARTKPDKAPPRLVAMLERKPFKVLVIAKAAQTARIVWAMLNRDEEYRPAKAAPLAPAAA